MNQMLEARRDADDYAAMPKAILIADGAGDTHLTRDAIAAAGMRLAAEFAFADALAQLGWLSHVDLIVIEAAGLPELAIEPVLARVDAMAAEFGAGVVVTLGEDQLDLAAAQLLGANAQLLCRPTPAERLSAIVLGAARPRGRLHDTTRDSEITRLHRLNEEVARIAETLARLTRSDEPEPSSSALREPGNGYRGAEEDGANEVTAAEIRATIRARRMRAQFFAPDLFADPAWDMLLDLFAAELERRRVSVSSLCIAASVPPTTALRWIGAMHDAGLFERHADPADRRRAYIALSVKGIEGMRTYVGAVKRAGLTLV